MGLKSNEIDPLLIRQLKQTANKPVTRLVLLTGFNTPPTPSQEGSQLQPVTKQIVHFFLYWHIATVAHYFYIATLFQTTKPRRTNSPGFVFVCFRSSQRSNRRTLFHYFSIINIKSNRSFACRRVIETVDQENLLHTVSRRLSRII